MRNKSLFLISLLFVAGAFGAANGNGLKYTDLKLENMNYKNQGEYLRVFNCGRLDGFPDIDLPDIEYYPISKSKYEAQYQRKKDEPKKKGMSKKTPIVVAFDTTFEKPLRDSFDPKDAESYKNPSSGGNFYPPVHSFDLKEALKALKNGYFKKIPERPLEMRALILLSREERVAGEILDNQSKTYKPATGKRTPKIFIAAAPSIMYLGNVHIPGTLVMNIDSGFQPTTREGREQGYVITHAAFHPLRGKNSFSELLKNERDKNTLVYQELQNIYDRYRQDNPCPKKDIDEWYDDIIANPEENLFKYICTTT